MSRIAHLLTLCAAVMVIFGATAMASEKNPQQGGSDKESGGGTRNQQETTIDYLPLEPAGSPRLRIEQLHVLVPGGSVTFLAGDGVLRRNENRLDLGGLPLLGQLFSNDRVSADDLRDDVRIGSAFAEDGQLAIVLPGSPGLVDPDAVLLNGDFSYHMQGAPRASNGADLATRMPNFAAIPVVSRLLAGKPLDGDSFVLSGLNREATRADPGLPAFGDTPLLQRFFIGGVYEKGKRTLLILIRPSIIQGNE